MTFNQHWPLVIKSVFYWWNAMDSQPRNSNRPLVPSVPSDSTMPPSQKRNRGSIHIRPLLKGGGILQKTHPPWSQPVLSSLYHRYISNNSQKFSKFFKEKYDFLYSMLTVSREKTSLLLLTSNPPLALCYAEAWVSFLRRKTNPQQIPEAHLALKDENSILFATLPDRFKSQKGQSLQN